jgi:hypothetical protein
MGRNIFIMLCSLFLSSLLVYSQIRSIIYSIFVANKNNKSANKIRKEQPFINKFEMNYIFFYLKKYISDYNRYIKLKKFYESYLLISLILIIILCFFNFKFDIAIVVFYTRMFLFDTPIFIYLMTKTEIRKGRSGRPWKYEK